MNRRPYFHASQSRKAGQWAQIANERLMPIPQRQVDHFHVGGSRRLLSVAFLHPSDCLVNKVDDQAIMRRDFIDSTVQSCLGNENRPT